MQRHFYISILQLMVKLSLSLSGKTLRTSILYSEAQVLVMWPWVTYLTSLASRLDFYIAKVTQKRLQWNLCNFSKKKGIWMGEPCPPYSIFQTQSRCHHDFFLDLFLKHWHPPMKSTPLIEIAVQIIVSGKQFSCPWWFCNSNALESYHNPKWCPDSILPPEPESFPKERTAGVHSRHWTLQFSVAAHSCTIWDLCWGRADASSVLSTGSQPSTPTRNDVMELK